MDMVKYSEMVARHVFDPNYLEGAWFVEVKNKRKVCSNYTTAVAWAKYLTRNGFSFISIGKVGK